VILVLQLQFISNHVLNLVDDGVFSFLFLLVHPSRFRPAPSSSPFVFLDAFSPVLSGISKGCFQCYHVLLPSRDVETSHSLKPA